MATKKYVCKVCGYVHEGEKAPEVCPLCKAPASEFEVQGGDGEKKKGLNTNSDWYSIVYALVVVIIVAFMLAFVSSALGEKQQQNIQLDKKKQVLSSLNINDAADAAAKYDEVVLKEYVVNSKGEKIEDVDLIKLKNDAINDDYLPIYECSIDGETKYVLPMLGQGLWGNIWGYVAVNSDRNTIYGVYFSHSSETPGLGAEITSDKFKSQFPDKLLFVEDTPLAVQKAAKEGNVINAISGATITCNGVNAMIEKTLGQYKSFLQGNACAQETASEKSCTKPCEKACDKACEKSCEQPCEKSCTESCTEPCEHKCEQKCAEGCHEQCTVENPEECTKNCENCPKKNVEQKTEEVK